MTHAASGEVTGTTIARKHAWGLDLSQSVGGAGGIGGLLASVDTLENATASDDRTFAYFYDGNGNVIQLVETTGGTSGTAFGGLVARYEYDPYGRPLLDVADASVSGAYAATNTFRFSTKPVDAETSFSYFGYRYYSATMGRWISRDPIGELGGPNLFHMVNNSTTTRIDPLGLDGSYLGDVASGVGDFLSGLASGLSRTVDGFGGLWGSEESERVGRENWAFLQLCVSTVSYGLSESSPIVQSVNHILGEYYDQLPQCVRDELVRKAMGAANKAAYHQGGQFVGRVTASMGTSALLRSYLQQLARSSTYSALAKVGARLGWSSAGGAGGAAFGSGALSSTISVGGIVAIPALLGVNGFLEQASESSQRLKALDGPIWNYLNDREWDIGYFLIEQFANPIVKQVQIARADPAAYGKKIAEKFCCKLKDLTFDDLLRHAGVSNATAP